MLVRIYVKTKRHFPSEGYDVNEFCFINPDQIGEILRKKREIAIISLNTTYFVREDDESIRLVNELLPEGMTYEDMSIEGDY